MGYYETTEPTFKVNVLGTEYEIYDNVREEDDEFFKTCSGYCDKTAKRIAVTAEPEDSELIDWEAYHTECLRHEIIHAFMHESGIDANCKFDVIGEDHPEHMVSWMAIQFPKILKVFQEINAI